MEGHLIINTVGTSIFENCALRNTRNKNFLKWYEPMKRDAVPFQDWYTDLVEEDVESIKGAIKKWDGYKKRNTHTICAEVDSNQRILESLAGRVHIYLIATDTVLSVLAAILIKEWYEGWTIDTIELIIHFDLPPNGDWEEGHAHIVKGLKIDNGQNYQSGFLNMTSLLTEIYQKRQSSKHQTTFNITGGYKALIPILTIFGQIYEIPLVYLYNERGVQGESELITINQIPLEFDWTVIEENYTILEQCFKYNSNQQLIEKNMPDEELFKSSIDDKVYQGLVKSNFLEQFSFKKSKKVRFGYLGYIAFKRYLDLFDKGLFRRQNMLSKLIELKVYKYWASQKNTITVAGKTIGTKGYDIDIYVQKPNGKAHFIEVKSGGNIPIKKIGEMLISGGYHYAVNHLNELNPNSPPKQITFDLYLYHFTEIHPLAIKNLSKLYHEVLQQSDDQIELKAYQIKLPSKYKTDFNWEVNHNNLIELSLNLVNNKSHV